MMIGTRLCWPPAGADGADRLDAVHLRHLDVHRDQVGLELLELAPRPAGRSTRCPTTSMSGSSESTSVTILRTTTESSTTITLIGFHAFPRSRLVRPVGRLHLYRHPSRRRVLSADSRGSSGHQPHERQATVPVDQSAKGRAEHGQRLLVEQVAHRHALHAAGQRRSRRPAAPSRAEKPPSTNAWTAISWAAASVRVRPETCAAQEASCMAAAHGRRWARPASTASRQRRRPVSSRPRSSPRSSASVGGRRAEVGPGERLPGGDGGVGAGQLAAHQRRQDVGGPAAGGGVGQHVGGARRRPPGRGRPRPGARGPGRPRAPAARGSGRRRWCPARAGRPGTAERSVAAARRRSRRAAAGTPAAASSRARRARTASVGAARRPGAPAAGWPAASRCRVRGVGAAGRPAARRRPARRRAGGPGRSRASLH